MISDPNTLIVWAFVIFLAVGLHEYAHCKFADLAGDPTPRFYGRVTLNLFKHFDPLGTVLMFFTMLSGFGIGWGKPAPMNPDRMRDPRWDFFIAVAAGPISNLVQAILYGLLGRLLLSSGTSSLYFANPDSAGHDMLVMLVFYGVYTNLAMAFFNLIPLGPLDGHWLLGLLLPDRPRDRWYLFNRRHGWYILLAIVIGGQITRINVIGMVLTPIITPLFRVILGL